MYTCHPAAKNQGRIKNQISKHLRQEFPLPVVVFTWFLAAWLYNIQSNLSSVKEHRNPETESTSDETHASYTQRGSYKTPAGRQRKQAWMKK